jgi:hypothetical protein
MNNISFLLEKYLSLGLKEENIKKIIVESIKEGSGVDVDITKIKVQKNIIKINDVFGVQKSEIFMNKNEIDEIMKNKLEKKDYKFSDRELM